MDVDLKLPPEESSSDLVINGKAPICHLFSKTTWLKNWKKEQEITAVAAIVEHNTSGIISRKSDNVSSPKDLVGKNTGHGMTQLNLLC